MWTFDKLFRAERDVTVSCKDKEVNNGVRFSAYRKAFCTCQMPEEGQYVIYDKCKIWYHPSCQEREESEIPPDGIAKTKMKEKQIICHKNICK